MLTVEWDKQYDLSTPKGVMSFNTAISSPFTSEGERYLYLLDWERCKATPGPLRVTSGDVPQDDGSYFGRMFKHGMSMQLVAHLYVEEGDGTVPDLRPPACDIDRRVMIDTLAYYLESLRNPSDADLFGGNARIGWIPSGADARILDRLRLVEWPDPSNGALLTTVQFTVQSEFAYGIDAAEISTLIGVSTNVTNAGSSPMHPVFRIAAVGDQIDEFTLVNLTTGLEIVYDASLPNAAAIGSGDFLEIDTFRNVAYLNGAGANRKAGIDLDVSDFFTLDTGGNSLSFSTSAGGAPTCTMYWQSGWS